MSWKILWDEKHLEEIENSYGAQIRRKAEKKMSDKQEQLEHFKKPDKIVLPTRTFPVSPASPVYPTRRRRTRTPG
ncbi:MAG: hypothetical protein ABEJ72_05400, partial [Candidatus Aenigmatarchaeota archaeon]